MMFGLLGRLSVILCKCCLVHWWLSGSFISRPFESAMNRPFGVVCCGVVLVSVRSSVTAFVSSFCSFNFAAILLLSSLILVSSLCISLFLCLSSSHFPRSFAISSSSLCVLLFDSDTSFILFYLSLALCVSP